MKKNYFALAAAMVFVAVMTTGCKDPNEGPTGPVIEVSTSLDAFNEKYDINMQVLTVADSVEWRNNGDVDLPTRYTVTTEAKALELANFLEKEVFPLFGDEFIANVMPPKIFVADSVVYTYYDEVTDVNPDWVEKNVNDMSYKDMVEMSANSTNVKVDVNLYGDVSNYHLTLATNHLEDADKKALMKNYVSLIIERMMANTNKWPVPTEFIKVSEDAHKIMMNDDINPGNTSAIYQHFYQTQLSGTKQKTLMYAGISKYDPAFSVWWFCGALNPNRYGPMFYSGYTQAYCDQFNRVYEYKVGDAEYTSPADNFYWFQCMTYQQDFGDFVAHIMFDSPAEKAALFARIDAASWDNIDSNTNEVLITRRCDSQKMNQKTELVKSYFKTNFDITLPEAK